MMETTREHFNVIVQKYMDYLNLYRYFNNGSMEGITPFDQFYWRMTYYVKYHDTTKIGSNS